MAIRTTSMVWKTTSTVIILKIVFSFNTDTVSRTIVLKADSIRIIIKAIIETTLAPSKFNVYKSVTPLVIPQNGHSCPVIRKNGHVHS